MIIDLTNIVTNNVDVINIDTQVCFDQDILNDVNIRKLKDVSFVGKVRKLYDSEYELEGVLSGVMVLADDITLEDVDYKFSVSILENIDELGEDEENNLNIVNNRLDISDFLWQNIVLEIPSKVVSEKSRDVTLEGNGWRFVTEEELEKEKDNDSPFNELDNKF